MELRKFRRQIISGIVLGVFCSVAAEAIECYTPLQWQPKLGSRWNRDVDGDNVEDDIYRLFESGNNTVNILLDLNECPSVEDLQRFAQFGTVGYIAKSISVVQLLDVTRSGVEALAQDVRVAMVEQDSRIQPALDVTSRSLRVRSSSVYSPNTLEDQAPSILGTGITVAILDSGVMDGQHPGLPSDKFVGGFDALTGIEGNPVDSGGGSHGTAIAGVILGTGEGGPPEPPGRFRGIAPKAKLVDIRVIGGGTPQTDSVARLIAGIDKCIERRLDWNINVMNISVTARLRTTNGLDAASQAANRAVQEGMVVVVALPQPNTTDIPSSNSPLYGIQAPGAADDVISVGTSLTSPHVFLIGSTIPRDDDIALYTGGPRLDDGDSDPTEEFKPDVSAPANAIVPSIGLPLCEFVPYCFAQGSSISAAHVSGIAALVLQRDPHLRPLEVKQRIIDTAEDFHPADWDDRWGHGLVDAYNAFNNIPATPGGSCQTTQTTDLLASSIAAEDPFLLVSGVPNALRGEICNQGPQIAGAFRVRLSAYLFSDSDANYPVCTVRVPAGLGVGDCTHVRCAWTPRVSGISTVEHACVKEEIIYHCDTNGGNQYAQANLTIKNNDDARRFAMRIVNPKAENLKMEIRPQFTPACGGWSFTQSDAAFFMAAAQCGRTVDFSLTPHSGTTASCKADVAVEGVRPDGTRLPFMGVTLVGAVPEPDRPLCVISGSGTDERGRKFISIKAQDTKSGMAGINVIKSQNASVRLPKLDPGGTGAVFVTATKIDQNLSSSTELDVIDAAGNVTRCDPLLVTLNRTTGRPVTETFAGIPQAERYLSVHNGDPGVTNLSVEVNGKKFQLGGLKPGEVREIDLGSAMVAGNGNTVSFTAQGKPGSEVVTLLHD